MIDEREESGSLVPIYADDAMFSMELAEDGGKGRGERVFFNLRRVSREAMALTV